MRRATAGNIPRMLRSIVREVKKLLLRRSKAQLDVEAYDLRALEDEARAVGPDWQIRTYTSYARFQRKMQARNEERVAAANAELKAMLAMATPEELQRLLSH